MPIQRLHFFDGLKPDMHVCAVSGERDFTTFKRVYTTDCENKIEEIGIKKTKNVIAVAGGLHKVKAIIGALNSSAINTFIINNIAELTKHYKLIHGIYQYI